VKVAYLINQYPKVSHSFIRREILALERHGMEVLRVAMRGWDGELVDADDRRERERTRYALQGGAAPLLRASLGQLLRAPRRFLTALRLALKMAGKADRPLPVHLVYLAEACWVARQLQQEGSRHLHAHFGTNSAEVAMLAHVLCGIPYSFTVHGPDEFDRPEFIGLEEKIRRSAFVVAVSSYGRSQLFRWVGQEQWGKVKVIHCGLENAFHDGPATWPPDQPRLVCVGRLCEQKGQLILIAAAAALARDGIEFELVLAGDGEMRAQIEAEITRYRLGERVRITGWIDGAQVRREIESARALVLPSFAEGLPVVIMEAMALRRPVLATYVAGIPELVVPGETGWLVPAGSVTDLVGAMKACLAMSVDALQSMGTKSRERVLLRHDIDRESARLADLFRESAPGSATSGVGT
jgi:colanic acid/amylovoran biosynthesis glycosyltransferase